jgi:radical SAM superfamily enzyme YgiQ (UPF0313 family)
VQGAGPIPPPPHECAEGQESPEIERTHVPAPDGSRAMDYESVNLDAKDAGAQPWDTIPAAVPVFDPKLVDKFRYSGLQIMKRFHFDADTMLRFSRFENDRIVVLPHIFIRGCNAPCGFCTYAYSKIEGEDLEATVAGLKFLSERYNCKHFHFLNTQINSVYRYAEAFCEKLIEDKLNILWSDCANMRSLDEALLEKMRRSGAMRLVFGVESPEDSMLKMINKGINVEKIDISVAARVLAQFSERLKPEQRVGDKLGELGEIVKTPNANVYAFIKYARAGSFCVSHPSQPVSVVVCTESTKTRCLRITARSWRFVSTS